MTEHAVSGVPVVTRDPEILGDARLAIVVAVTAALLLGRWLGVADRARPLAAVVRPRT